MPDNRFYNMSYLERADNNFRRGPTSDYKLKSQTSTHYHRPGLLFIVMFIIIGKNKGRIITLIESNYVADISNLSTAAASS